MSVITYGDPAYPNFTTWVDSLLTTDLPQGTARLVTINDRTGEPEGYCCLGEGCVIAGYRVDKFHLHDEDGEETDLYDEVGYILGADELAPREFLEWLGIDESLLDGGQGDVCVDYPPDLKGQGIALVSDGGRIPERPEGQRPVPLTASAMNDTLHLTFRQIGETLRYFGIRAG